MSAAGPILALFIVASTVGFEAMVYGTNTLEQGTVPLFAVNFANCSGHGTGAFGLQVIACWIGSVVLAFVNIFVIIYNAGAVAINAVSFNVPGAPPIVRAVIGTVIVATIAFSVATLYRGGGK